MAAAPDGRQGERDMSQVIPGLTAPLVPDNRIAQQRQGQVPAGQLALQQRPL